MAEALALIRVAASEHAILNGVAVSPQGRVFSSFPRWRNAATPSLGEVMPDGTFRTFPGDRWNEWREGLDPAAHFVNVHSICADADNFLWAVDDAAPHHQPRLKGGAKVVKIDLRTDRVVRAFPMDESVAPPGAVLGHMRVLGKHAFITESGHGAIIVLDQETGATRLVLRGDPKTQADRSIVPVIDGKEFSRADGEVSVVNVNLLELSHDGCWLYFTCLFGPALPSTATAGFISRPSPRTRCWSWRATARCACWWPIRASAFPTSPISDPTVASISPHRKSTAFPASRPTAKRACRRPGKC